MKQSAAQSNLASASQASASQASAPINAPLVTSGGTQASEQAIRERAYAIYESYPDASRTPELNWLEAEDQLRTESN